MLSIWLGQASGRCTWLCVMAALLCAVVVKVELEHHVRLLVFTVVLVVLGVLGDDKAAGLVNGHRHRSALATAVQARAAALAGAEFCWGGGRIWGRLCVCVCVCVCVSVYCVCVCV